MTQAPTLQRPAGPVATETRLVQRLVAGGYDWAFDHVDPLGGADHRRRLVEQASGEVLEIGAGTGRNLPLYRTATRVVALEPGPGMRARAKRAARTARRNTCRSPRAHSTRWSPAWCCAPSPTLPGRWRRPVGCCARAGGCASTSTSGPTTRGWPAGRTGWSDPGAGWPEAATPTATSWRPSPPPASACWSWTGSTSRSCPRWSAPTSSGWPSDPPIRAPRSRSRGESGMNVPVTEATGVIGRQAIPRLRLAIGYAVMAVALAATLLGSFALGSRQEPAVNVAGVYRVDPPAPCLGGQVEVRQSGRFVDLAGERGAEGTLELDGHRL